VQHSVAKRETDEADEITQGSGNVFADLGHPAAEERQTKLRLAFRTTPGS